jgi:hypothetical protein
MKKEKKRENIKNRKIRLNNKTAPSKWDFLKMEKSVMYSQELTLLVQYETYRLQINNIYL